MLANEDGLHFNIACQQSVHPRHIDRQGLATECLLTFDDNAF